MRYKRLIETNLNKAFEVAGDLAVTVSSLEGISASFDFTTGLASNAAATPVVAKGLITKKITDISGNVSAKLILKGTAYSIGAEVTLGASRWKVTNLDFVADSVSLLSISEVSNG